MQRKPPYTLPTEETEDGSSEEHPRDAFINSLDHANIVDVWADNFHQEIEKISQLTKKYHIIAIDTEFPSIEEYNDKFLYFTEMEHQKYARLTKNVDSTSLIQLGLCLADESGNVPGDKFCWQFNFKFEGDIEQISPSSAFLLRKAGIDFEKLKSQGISYKTFTHEFIKSGLLLNKKNKWVVFHGSYDFSYLLRLIKNECAPKSTQDFYKSLKIYFPQKVDLKLLIQGQKKFRKLGLSKLADTILVRTCVVIQCRRIGPQHQAGSDALLTLQCYFKIRHQFEHLMDGVNHIDNQVFGIGVKQTARNQVVFYPQCQQYGYYQPQSYPAMQQNFIQYQYANSYLNPYNNSYSNPQAYQSSYQGYQHKHYRHGDNWDKEGR